MSETPAINITFAPDGARKCGGCTLCCKLLPIRELGTAHEGDRARHLAQCPALDRDPGRAVCGTLIELFDKLEQLGQISARKRIG